MAKNQSGLSIGARLIITFLGFVVILAISLTLVYKRYVPALVNGQVNLRAIAITKSFASAVLEPVMVRNYLRVNKIAEMTVTLPDVAYAAVYNKRGFPIAGIFGDLSRFDQDFVSEVKKKGFPKNIADQNKATSEDKICKKTLTIGQQSVLDIALASGRSGVEVHLGIFTGDIDKAIRASLMPLLSLLAIMAVLGTVAIVFVSHTVSRPIRQLTQQVHDISMGKLDLKVDVKGSGEIGALVESFRRMQVSLKILAQQMKKKI